jgi:hypothetical protein
MARGPRWLVDRDSGRRRFDRSIHHFDVTSLNLFAKHGMTVFPPGGFHREAVGRGAISSFDAGFGVPKKKIH